MLTFQATRGFTGAASFGFQVSNGRNVLTGQRFSLNVERNFWNFAGTTQGQVIVGSATLDNDIEGSDGADNITGGKANDRIIGGKGKDTINGGDDDDTIDGGDDEDDIQAGGGKDNLKAGKGNDTVNGGDGDDSIDGGEDNDSIDAGIGNDNVIGGSGNDALTGNEGDDSIEGGEGTNSLTGGPGRDSLIYRTSRQQITTVAEADFITDFNVNEDVLEFSNAAFSLSTSSLSLQVITAAINTPGSLNGNLLDFTQDVTVTSIATLQARFAALGGNPEAPIFCEFIDATTGRAVLVFAVGARFEIIATFSASIRLEVRNFVFTGPPLTIPVGTAGPDNVDLATCPALLISML